MSTNPKIYPLVSADVALFSVADDRLQVLLVRRAREPELHGWALPGAVLKPELDRDLEATARRALRDKVSIELPHVEPVATFSGPDRDPRGWSVAQLFLALLARDQVQAVKGSKVEEIRWADADRGARGLAFDHGAQLAAAREALRDKVERYRLPLHLLPPQFTLTELQRVVEAVLRVSRLDKGLDKGAFRRRLKASDELVAIRGEFARGAQRPAQLYRAREGFVF
jgi:ADP-ribose pyrophosphatase YjhB (NUDIX family)